MSEEKKVTRLDPMPSPDGEFFWDAADKELLVAQRCADCKTYSHPPKPMCSNCHSLNREQVELSGKGFIYSWVLPQHPKMPFFEYPLITAIVELDEGIRLLTNIVNCDPSEVKAGMRVTVAFEPTANGRKVPVFELDKSEGAQ